MSDSPRDVVMTVLPKSWSENKRVTLADEILDALDEAGLLAVEEITSLMVSDALTPVETVEAYGLEIALDALGEASEISSARGLVVLA